MQTQQQIGVLIGSMDITNEWTKTRGTEGTVTERQEYTVNGTIYKVDGKHVILHPTKQEREVAAILSGKYGKHVEFVPQVVLIYGLIAKKHKQADNFIIDISECPLSVEEVERQIESLYTSPRLGFLEQIILMKNEEVLKVYGRK